MHRCLVLAQQAGKDTGVNPLVGSVLVHDGSIVEESYHEKYGNFHSERLLIEKYEQKSRTKKSKSHSDNLRLYVNLEPCCHHGKTPPCTELIIKHGIRTVVYGMEDPNPLMRGNGVAELMNAGIEVIGPVLPELCQRINRGFISVQLQNRPWITLKRAVQPKVQQDGDKPQYYECIANDDGSPRKITSVIQDEWAHDSLRSQHDSLLVGVQTIISDNPHLTTRSLSKKNELKWQPWRIILDPQFRIPLNCHVVSAGTIIVCNERVFQQESELKVKALEAEAAGARLVCVPLTNGTFDFKRLFSLLMTPHFESGFYGVKSVLVEGGRRTWQFFREAGALDEEVIFTGHL